MEAFVAEVRADLTLRLRVEKLAFSFSGAVQQRSPIA
jgi:hypothetical protein